MTGRLPDILCVSSIDWDFIWQGHQEIMARMAARGHRVLFVENTGVRAPKVRDLPRVRQRIRNWWRGTKGFREERPNLFVYSPLLLPLPYFWLARWINRWLLTRALRRWMQAIGFTRPVLWTFLPTPLALDVIRAVDPQVTIYYCIDDLASSSPGARRIVSSEARLFKQADLVFVTSERLRERAARYTSRVHLFPFGVNLERFEAVRSASEEAPADVTALGRPIVGYVGGLHQWVDQPLLASVASKLPDISFALVGPAQTDVSVLEGCANMTLFGQRSHEDLPRYVKQFDVGIVPYLLTEYTANVYPTKLNEYLIMGIPVVATDLPEIRRFNREHGDVVEVAGTADAFAAAIRKSLNGASAPAVVQRRIAVAGANSWERRIEAMNRLIDETAASRAASDQRWDQALRRMYRRTRAHVAEIVIAVVATYLLVFQTNLVWRAASPLLMSEPPKAADAIVVFFGGVGETGKAGGGAPERLNEAVALYRGGYSKYLVLSSGYVYSFKEAEGMRDLAVAQGVPAGSIVLEERATNTHQNVTYVNDILRDHKWRSILLVSSPYHMRRATMTWKKLAPEVSVTPTPPPRSQFYAHDSRGASFEQVRGILYEYLAILGYWKNGWL
jgi:uncharacterized SAM-binding protein YcdF (DUF218 family)/glycosyltransferase involved in cell wall biosynthesis